MNPLEEFVQDCNGHAVGRAEKTEYVMSISELMQESEEDEQNQGNLTNDMLRHLVDKRALKEVATASQVLNLENKVQDQEAYSSVLQNEQFLTSSKERINIDKVSRANVQKMVHIFEKAANKIIEAFYMLASNDEYLRSMKEKLNAFKRQVNRSFVESMKRVTKTKDELQYEEKEELQSRKRLKAKNCKIPASSTVILEAWLMENFHFPYPTEKERQNLAKESGMSLVQVNNWFINKREKIIRRYLKKDTGLVSDLKENDSGVSEEESQSSEFDQEKQVSNQ